MRVLQVTTTTVYPPRQGGSHRAHGLVCAFPSSGATIDRFCQGGLFTNHLLEGSPPRLSPIQITEGYHEYRPVNPFHDLASIPRLFGLPNFALSSWLRSWPPGTLQRLTQTADIVMVEGPLQVFAMAELASPQPVVYSSHNVETERVESHRGGYIGGKIAKKMRKWEQIAVNCADAIVCTSEEDANTYREEFGAAQPIHVAPNGTYTDNLVDHPPSTDSERSRAVGQYGVDPESMVAVFIGSDYEPNREGARALLRVMEKLAERSANVELLVAGTVCESLGATPRNVTPIGFVDDLQTFLRAADIALNPVTSGGGSNVKMLDYFSAGLPVISTSFGARGFDVTDGRELLVRDLGEFADAIETLQSHSRRESLGRNALAYVKEEHLWEDISAEVLEWYEETLV